MPRAEPLEYDFEAEFRKYQENRSRDRSEGRHLSEILHRIVARIDPNRFASGEMDHALFQGGFIWEDINSEILGRQMRGSRGQSQIEIVKDRIIMTPDDFDPEPWRVIEFKDTKISAGNPIRSAKFWHWHVQIGCYCLALDTLEAELFVRFINGSYELGGGRFGKTIGRKWLLRYAPRELKEYWKMILRERDRMDAEAEEVG